jgi:hypothetical protein
MQFILGFTGCHVATSVLSYNRALTANRHLIAPVPGRRNERSDVIDLTERTPIMRLEHSNRHREMTSTTFASRIGRANSTARIVEAEPGS